MLKRTVTGLKPLFWLFLILTTLNISTGAVIVLVASGPNGEALDNDAATVPVGEMRLLHLELFGGIIHFHPTGSPGSATSTGLNLNIIENQAVVQSFDKLFISVATAASYVAPDPNPGLGPDPHFSHQTQLAVTGEIPDPAGLKNGEKVISSSGSEPGLSRAFSPNFQQPEKSVAAVQFKAPFQPRAVDQPQWPGTFPNPPEKPPRTVSYLTGLPV